MMKKLAYNQWKHSSVILDSVIDRSISCSATQNQDILTENFSNRLFPEKLRKELYSKEINVERMTTLLDGNNRKLKDSLRQFLCSEIMKPRYDISLKEQRVLSHRRLKEVCRAGFMSVINFKRDPQSIFDTHELAAVVDPAMAFKMNAQFNWFAGTLMKLGTEKNYLQLMEKIDHLSTIGCLGLTELGCGNNIMEMETTAVYDHDTNEIVIDTPNPLAQKYWVTNAAEHAQFMIVFAHLFVDEENYGIHGILVRIRDENLKVKPDVHIEDMGHNMGLHGIDTAKVSFDSVRVPSGNLLNKFCDIATSGQYISPITRSDQKILVMCDELLSGKISVAAMCSGAAKASLAIAIKYSATRLALGPTGKQDVPVLQYQLQYKALIPLLARTYVLHFGLNYVTTRYCHQPENGEHHSEIVTLACALKALLSWNLENVVKVCRERCGGQGFLSCNRFGSFLGLAHAAVSVEGDNSVLMQKVVRERLGVAKPREVTGIYRDFSSLDFLYEVLTKKESLLYLELKRKVFAGGKEKAFDLWVLEESDLVQACGMAFAERFVAEYFVSVICKCDKNEKVVLGAMHRLYIYNIIQRDIGLFIKHGIIGAEDITAIEYESGQLCRNLSECSLELVDAFAFPDEMLSAPVARDWVHFNTSDNKGEV